MNHQQPSAALNCNYNLQLIQHKLIRWLIKYSPRGIIIQFTKCGMFTWLVYVLAVDDSYTPEIAIFATNFLLYNEFGAREPRILSPQKR